MCTTQVFDSTSLEAVESEMCNGEDDDCDGQIDEGLERRCQTNVMGCEEGVQQCEAGEWGLCTPAPLEIRERCNGIDDDCDGEIDEEPVVNPVGETGCAATVSCDECDKDWRPVCTARGVVPNECLAECQGLSVLEPAECGLRVPLTSRCSTNADCALSACEDPRSAICIGVRERVSCVSLAPTALCFRAAEAPCGCDRVRGVCTFGLIQEVLECIESTIDAGPSTSTEPNENGDGEPNSP